MPAPPCGKYGDVTYSGEITGTDSYIVQRYLNGETTLSADQKLRADVDGDGVVTQEDANLIANFAVGNIDTFPICSILRDCDQRCDFNGDGVVDELDQTILTDRYGSKPGDANWNPACDLNNDGLINIGDLIIFNRSLGCTFVSFVTKRGAILKIDGVTIV